MTQVLIAPASPQTWRISKPHVYKKGGFYRIALPAVGALPAREYWYIDCASVRAFLTHYWGKHV